MAVDFDQHHRSFVAAETQAMILEGDNAGAAVLNHSDVDAPAQAHFFQADDQLEVPIDLEDSPFFAGTKQFQRDDLLQLLVFQGLTIKRRARLF